MVPTIDASPCAGQRECTSIPSCGMIPRRLTSVKHGSFQLLVRHRFMDPVSATRLIRSEISRTCQGGSRDYRYISSSDGTHDEFGLNALVHTKASNNVSPNPGANGDAAVGTAADVTAFPVVLALVVIHCIILALQPLVSHAVIFN